MRNGKAIKRKVNTWNRATALNVVRRLRPFVAVRRPKADGSELEKYSGQRCLQQEFAVWCAANG